MQIKLEIRRNLTILQGKSATGKSTLIDLIQQYEELGESSGVTINCDVDCRVLSGRNWQRDLEEIDGSIVFIDEDNAFMKSHEFAQAAKNSTNYYVLVARESLPQLPYSVDEIFGLRNATRTSSKYPAYKRVYTSTYRIFGSTVFSGERPELVVVEDSNAGYEFFCALCERSGVSCVSASGKSNIYPLLRKSSATDILVIADGAAFGSEMAYVSSLMRFKSIRLFLPESFEWLVLKSSLFNDARTQDMLLNPSDYIESSDFFSWEQFFTKELIERTRDSYLAYSKKSLGDAYLRPRELRAIASELPDLGI
ncbi:MAG: hypothetical protein Q4B77_07750 [Coriobacteriaceae bacterium]|nr:hypothetical protein [Coriobacteriaceae bacterium]